jgi:hypothetical protein
MRPRKKERIVVPPRTRKSLVIIGVILMCPGLAALFQGTLFYRDYRALLVFAPFSLLIGLVMIVFAIRVGREK